jgi:hypothetical protein
VIELASKTEKGGHMDRGRNTLGAAGAGTLLLLAGILAGFPQSANAANWDPEGFAKQDTLKLRTVCPGEGAYAFPVWLVIIDNQVYVRLGTRAAERIACNSTAPFLGVEIAGQTFEHVHGIPAPEYAERVAKAMADKYTSDLFIHLFSHPLTLRLVPE